MKIAKTQDEDEEDEDEDAELASLLDDSEEDDGEAGESLAEEEYGHEDEEDEGLPEALRGGRKDGAQDKARTARKSHDTMNNPRFIRDFRSCFPRSDTETKEKRKEENYRTKKASPFSFFLS